MKKLLLIAVLLTACILRFYNLSGYLQFLGDQGRDVAIVRSMIVDHKWTLLGPSASVGGFFTGPIYYYMMLPFLWLFNLDPVGPAYMSAIIGVFTVVLTFVFVKKFFSPRAGLIAALLMAISPKMVEISRFSWNPNPMPLFALLTVFFLYLSLSKGKIIFTLLAGISLGILFQLHYMGMVFIPIAGLILIVNTSPKKWIPQLFLLGLGFVLGDSLFLIFELRHGFPNTLSVWEFISRRGQTVAPRSLNFSWLLIEMSRRLYGMLFGFRDTYWEYLFLIGSLVGLLSWRLDKLKATILLVWFIVGTFGMGSYQGALHDHYFGYLYPLPFIFLGASIDLLFNNKLKALAGSSTILFLGIFAYKSMFFQTPPQYMLSQIQEIDKIALSFANDQPFNLALISSFNTDYPYRYYLDIWKKPAVVLESPQQDSNKSTVTDQLIVICEDKTCQPLGHPIWEIAGFGRAIIVDQKMGPAGISVYKLVHY